MELEKNMDLKSPLKTLGLHEVEVKFNSELSGSFKINIEKEEIGMPEHLTRERVPLFAKGGLAKVLGV